MSAVGRRAWEAREMSFGTDAGEFPGLLGWLAGVRK